MSHSVGDLAERAAPASRRLATEHYADGCRRRIPAFVRRHYGLRSTLALHRGALGADLPLQAGAGLHRRRLERLVGAVGRRLLGTSGDYSPRDPYLARLLDLLDAARAAGTLLP